MTKTAFDFNRAVELMHRDYPAEAQHITFVDLNDAKALQTIRDWAPVAWPPSGFDEASIQHLANDTTSYAVTLPQGLLGLRPAGAEGSFFKDPHQDNLFSFHHEFCHLLLPAHKTADEIEDDTLRAMCTIGRESASDLFASIYGLRHGWMTVSDILHMSSTRAIKALNGDYMHTTSEALDWLASVADQYDWQPMTGAGIKAFVVEHAPRFMPSSSEVQDVVDLWNKTRKLDDNGEAFYTVLEDLHKTLKPQSPADRIVTKKLAHVLERPHQSFAVAARYADPAHARKLHLQLAEKASQPGTMKRMKPARAATWIWPS